MEKKEVVLLVEDVVEHAEYTRVLLEKAGYPVRVAASQKEAFKILQQHPVGIVLLDVLLPDGNGVDFCKTIRSSPLFAHIPIIFLTSKTEIEDKLSGFNAGADDYLTKPFKIQELIARIEVSLQKKKLIESENRYRNFVESLNDSVIMLNTGGNIVDANPRAVTILEQELADLRGELFLNFVHKMYKKPFQNFFQQILMGKDCKDGYIRVVTKGGKEIPFEVNGFAWKEGGRVIQVQMMLRDISERERMEKEIHEYTRLLEKKVEERTRKIQEIHKQLFLREKMAAIGQLAAGIAHELRNPLGIIGTSVYYLGRVLSGHKNPKLKEHLEIIQNEISRSQKIITNLLDFSQRSSMERESVDINKILRQTISLLERDLANSSIEIQFNESPLPHCFVNVDEMKQAFLNLLMNAKDAMPEGGTLGVKTYVCDHQFIGVDIADTGIGMSNEEISRIFEPFYTSKQDSGGVGLGLSLVHASIQRNRGKIKVKSEKGKGSTFTVMLPIVLS